jgi:GIY-YIG catalytic domain
MAKEKYTVYLLFLNNVTIYIGLTKNLEQRLKGHKDKKYDRVVRIPVDSKMYGLYLERMLTLTIRPKYAWIPLWVRNRDNEPKKEISDSNNAIIV